jgi:hypothetical protein
MGTYQINNGELALKQKKPLWLLGTGFFVKWLLDYEPKKIMFISHLEIKKLLFKVSCVI